MQDKVEAWRTAYNQLAEDIIRKGVNESELKRLVKAKLFPVYTEAAKVIRDRRLPAEVRQEIAGIVGAKDLFGYQVLTEQLKDKQYRKKEAVNIVSDIFTDRVVKNVLDNYDNFLRQKGRQILNTAAKMREFMEVVDSLKFRLQSQSAYEVHKDKLEKDKIDVLTAQKISEWEKSFKQKQKELKPEDAFRLLREKKIDNPPALFTDYQRWLLGATVKEILQQVFGAEKKEVGVIRIQDSASQTHKMQYQSFNSVEEFKQAYSRDKRHYYAFALPHEDMDDLGRGRKLTEEEVGMLVKEGKQRFQFWVEDAAGVEWLVVFNPADLEEQKAKKAAYKDSEEKLATVLAQAEYAVEMRVDEFGNPIDEPVGRYTAAQILEKKKIEGKKQTPVLDDAGIPVVVLSYKDEQGKTVERRISFWKEVEQEDGTIKLERVDAGKYGYDHIIADDTVTKNDPLHTGNRILFGENSVRYDLATAVMGEQIARSQIKSAEKSKEAMRKWKFVSKIFPVLGPVANEQVVDALRVLFNMAVSIQALPEVPTKEETQKFFEEKFGKRVIDALAIPKDLRPAAEKILEENKGDIAAITAKLNELTGLKLAEKQVQEAIENDGGERFFAFVQKALEEKDKGTLEEFLKQELRSERNIAMIKLVVYFVNDFAGAFNLKRDNNGLLNDFFAYFSGGEINLMTILGDAIDKKYLGRGEYMAKDTGRIFTGMGVTLDVFQLLKIDSTSDLYNPDILRFYVFGYPISLFGDEEAKVSKYIEARQKMFATEVSPDKNMITAVYEREEDLDKIKLKHVANIEIEKAGVKWPVYVNEETGGIILFGLPAYEKDFAKLEIKLERQQSIQKIKAGESGVIETISREAAPIMPERIIEKEQVGINDITDFILNFTNPNTLLNPSFYYKPGEKSIAYNRNLAYTYDEALAYFLLNMAGERELANAKAGFLSDTKGIYVFSHDTEKKHGELLGVANAINSVSRQGRILEDFPTSGPLAYLARLFLEEYNNTNDSRFLDAAIKLAEALEKRIADDGGVRKGVKRDVVRQGEEDHVKIQSGEENIVASRLFSELGELYQKDPEKYKQVEKFADLHTRVVNWKFAKLYDREKEYFVRGAFAGKKDNVFAADVNVQAILNEGPQAIDSRLGSGTAARLWQNTKDQARVEKLNVQRADGKEVNIAFMYDITNQAERDKLKQSGEVRPEAGFLEISAQMAVGHLVMADYYIKNGDIHAAGREIDEYKSLISNLDKLAVNVLGQGTVYPYATQANIRPFTGYPAKTPQAAIGSTAATTWMGFAKAGYNIFTKSYISAKLQNLAGISAPKRVMQFTPFERQIAKHNDAILRDKTNGENITVQAGERVKSAAEDKLDDLVYKQARLTQLREKGFAGLSEREKMELPQLLSGDYLVYFDEERSRYGYYDAWHQQLVEVTLNSSHKRIEQDIKRLELEVKFAAQELKLMDEGGVVLLNPDGTLRENGVLVGGQYLQEKLKQIRQMPLEQQYEISRRGWVYYAAQEGEEVIVWLRFPVKEKNEMRYADPLSGQETLWVYEHGNLVRSINNAEISELRYDECGVEIGANVYANKSGKIDNAQAQKADVIIKKSDSLRYDLSDKQFPLSIKRVHDYKNGDRLEVYAGYQLQPVLTISEKYITSINYDDHGRFKNADIWLNAGDLKKPKRAEKVFTEEMAAFNEKTFNVIVTRKDKRFADRENTIVRDWRGRKIQEKYVDLFESGQKFKTRIETEHRNDFESGIIPDRAFIYSDDTNELLKELKTLDFDPVKRTLIAVETDKKGRAEDRIIVWSPKYDQPVLYITNQRITYLAHNQEETENWGITFGAVEAPEEGYVTRLQGPDRRDIRKIVAELSSYADNIAKAVRNGSVLEMKGSDEIIVTSHAKYVGKEANTFTDTRQIWYDFGKNIPSRVEVNKLSSFGRFIYSTVGDELKRMPVYDASGIEQAQDVRRWNTDTKQFDIRYRYDDDYQWIDAKRDARVTMYYNGEPNYLYRAVQDALGRDMQNVFEFKDPIFDKNLKVISETKYIGATERRSGAQVTVNGKERINYTTEGVFEENGEFLEKVAAKPAFGIERRVIYPITNNYYGRHRYELLEGGRRSEVKEWIDGTNMARKVLLKTKDGRVDRVYEKNLNVEIKGQFDELREKKNSIFDKEEAVDSDNTLLTRKYVVPGTDIVLFKINGREITYYDPAEPFESPVVTRYVDEGGFRAKLYHNSDTGLTAELSRVIKVYNNPVIEKTDDPAATTLAIEDVDLKGYEPRKVTVNRLDREGNLQAVDVRIAPVRPEPVYDEKQILSSVKDFGRVMKSEFKGKQFEQLAVEKIVKEDERDNSYAVWLVSKLEKKDLEKLKFSSTDVRQIMSVWKQSRVENYEKIDYQYRKGYLVPEENGVYKLSERKTPQAIVINDDSREIPTHIFMQKLDGGAFKTVTLTLAKICKVNPYLPYLDDREWRVYMVERKLPSGKPGYVSEHWFDVQGNIWVLEDTKFEKADWLSTGLLAKVGLRPELEQERLAYRLPSSKVYFENHKLIKLDDTNKIEFNRSITSLSQSYFLAFYAGGIDIKGLTIKDEKGKEVKVEAGKIDYAKGIIPFYNPLINREYIPVTAGEKDFLLGETKKIVMAEVNYNDWKEGWIFMVSSTDLLKAGLDIGHISTISLSYERKRIVEGKPVSAWISEMLVLDNQAEAARNQEGEEFVSSSLVAQKENNSYLVVGRQKADETEHKDELFEENTSYMVLFEDKNLKCVVYNRRDKIHNYPYLLVIDTTQPDMPKPLYAVSPQDGTFFRISTVRPKGDMLEVEAVPVGMISPEWHRYNPNDIMFEVPREMIYGVENAVVVKKGRSDINNRITSNFFKWFWESMVNGKIITNNGIKPAVELAKEIDGLFLLSEVFIDADRLPWEGWTNDAAVITTEKETISKLMQPDEATGLIPPDTGEQYVNTKKEAQLVKELIRTGYREEAGKILDFYRTQFYEQGTRQLSESYDAASGEPLRLDVRYERVPFAEMTSDAQLEIADAALDFYEQSGKTTEDEQNLKFAEDILKSVFEKYRVDRRQVKAKEKKVIKEPENAVQQFRQMISGWIEKIASDFFEFKSKIEQTSANKQNLRFGIAQHLYRPEKIFVDGFKQWSRLQTYNVTTQTATYKLLKRLNNLKSMPEFKLNIENIENWFKTFKNIYAQEGTVPRGTMEVVEVNTNTVEMTKQTVTSTEDWLAFIETMYDIYNQDGNVSNDERAYLINSMNNLAKAHGVTAGDIWGLDYGIALTRQGAISSDLTYRFMKTAEKIGYSEAAAYTRSSLKKLLEHNQGKFPNIFSESQKGYLLTYQKLGEAVRKVGAKDDTRYPDDLLTTIRFFAPEVFDKATQVPTVSEKSMLERVMRQTADWTAPVLGFFGIDAVNKDKMVYLTFFAVLPFMLLLIKEIAFWILWKWRFRKSKQDKEYEEEKEKGRLAYDKVSVGAERRRVETVYAPDVPLGKMTLRGKLKEVEKAAKRILITDGPVEGNFLASLKQLYQVVWAWKKNELIPVLISKGLEQLRVEYPEFKEYTAEEVLDRVITEHPKFEERLEELWQKYPQDTEEQRRKRITKELKEKYPEYFERTLEGMAEAIAEDELLKSHDEWLNGLDEFALIMALVLRKVIKDGYKDSKTKEDSNLFKGRLEDFIGDGFFRAQRVMIAIRENRQNPEKVQALNKQMEEVLRSLGVEGRKTWISIRDEQKWANIQVNEGEITEWQVWTTPERKGELDIPVENVERFWQKYQEYKQKEGSDLLSLKTWFIELVRIMPVLSGMLFGIVVWTNAHLGGVSVFAHLAAQWSWFIASPFALPIAGLTVLALIFTIAGKYVRYARYEDEDTYEIKMKKGWLYNPAIWENASLIARILLFGGLFAIPLFAPGVTLTHYLIKALFVWISGVELFGMIAPLLGRLVGSGLQEFLKGYLPAKATADRAEKVLGYTATENAIFGILRVIHDFEIPVIKKRPGAAILNFINVLNITPSKPGSVLFESFKYYAQPSVPSGGWLGMTTAILNYAFLSAMFLGVGIFVGQAVVLSYFNIVYLLDINWMFVLASYIFALNLYLLRYAMTVGFTGAASFFATFPMRGVAFMASFLYALQGVLPVFVANFFVWAKGVLPVGIFKSLPVLGTAVPWAVVVLLIVLMFEERIMRAARTMWDELKSARSKDRGGITLIEFAGGDGFRSLVFNFDVTNPSNRAQAVSAATNREMERWKYLWARGDRGVRFAKEVFDIDDEEELWQLLDKKHGYEFDNGVSLFHPSQVVTEAEALQEDWAEDNELRIVVKDEQEKADLIKAAQIKAYLISGMSHGGVSEDTGTNIIDIVLAINSDKNIRNKNIVVNIMSNKYDDKVSADGKDTRPSNMDYSEGKEHGQRHKLVRLIERLTKDSKNPDNYIRAKVTHNWTPFGFKAAFMTGKEVDPETFTQITSRLVIDRNATVGDLDKFLVDLKRIRTDDSLVVVVPGRTTTSTLTYIGKASELIEAGHRSFVKGLMVIGGEAGESIGTGWGNFQSVSLQEVMRKMASEKAFIYPFSSYVYKKQGIVKSWLAKLYGLRAFAPDAEGISEDIWAVEQEARMKIGLGISPRFGRSRAIWTKQRESWSHAAWCSAFPRWSGGFPQKVFDKTMQNISELGPLSVFAKEIRANSSRFFLTAPWALLGIVIYPLAILAGVSPFVGIMLVFWYTSLLFNQILTVHGLVHYLEGSGFTKWMAVVGALLAYLFGLNASGIIIGYLIGGFIIGLGRWLFNRGTDALVFASQTVVHSLGQFIRQTLEFKLSGEGGKDPKGVDMRWRSTVGGNEDDPKGTFANFVNFRTVIRTLAFPLFVLYIVAIGWQLDFVNVLMLMPFIGFVIGLMVGPFTSSVPKGESTIWEVPARVLGWIAGFGLMSGATFLVSLGGFTFSVLGWILFLIPMLIFVLWASKHSSLLKIPGVLLNSPVIKKIVPASLLNIPVFLLNIPIIKKTVGKGFFGWEDTILQKVGTGKQARVYSAFLRSFAIAFFLFSFLFVVPLPSILRLEIGMYYEVSLPMALLTHFIGSVVGLIFTAKILSITVGRITEWRLGIRTKGLIEKFEEQLKKSQLNRETVAKIRALLYDVLVFIHQTNYGWVRGNLDGIDRLLGGKADATAVVSPDTGKSEPPASGPGFGKPDDLDKDDGFGGLARFATAAKDGFDSKTQEKQKDIRTWIRQVALEQGAVEGAAFTAFIESFTAGDYSVFQSMNAASLVKFLYLLFSISRKASEASEYINAFEIAGNGKLRTGELMVILGEKTFEDIKERAELVDKEIFIAKQIASGETILMFGIPIYLNAAKNILVVDTKNITTDAGFIKTEPETPEMKEVAMFMAQDASGQEVTFTLGNTVYSVGEKGEIIPGTIEVIDAQNKNVNIELGTGSIVVVPMAVVYGKIQTAEQKAQEIKEGLGLSLKAQDASGQEGIFNRGDSFYSVHPESGKIFTDTITGIDAAQKAVRAGNGIIPARTIYLNRKDAIAASQVFVEENGFKVTDDSGKVMTFIIGNPFHSVHADTGEIITGTIQGIDVEKETIDDGNGSVPMRFAYVDYNDAEKASKAIQGIEFEAKDATYKQTKKKVVFAVGKEFYWVDEQSGKILAGKIEGINVKQMAIKTDKRGTIPTHLVYVDREEANKAALEIIQKKTSLDRAVPKTDKKKLPENRLELINSAI
ncbi:MAG: hypothetical protein ABII75_00535 [Candidatus Omnitrophota bacterium]